MTDASDRQLLKAAGRRLLDQNEATHTPGPWTLNQLRNGIMQAESGEQIATMRGEGSTTDANAALIIAAPALLAAAVDLMEELRRQALETEGMVPFVMERTALRAAIEAAQP